MSFLENALNKIIVQLPMFHEDLQGLALTHFFEKGKPSHITLHNHLSETEKMPLDAFFRSENGFNVLEKLALSRCQGRVLDVGAGVGAHSLALQQEGKSVMALEKSALCCDIMTKRGVDQVVCKSIYEYHPNIKYDTLLLMMNGIGLAGKLANMQSFLRILKELLAPNGKILFDSSDIAYLEKQGIENHEADYYGEVEFQYAYKRMRSDWFPWIYIDKDLMEDQAHQAGFKMDILFESDDDQYLAELSL
ncbi:MAG: class I SAM-dependent methyltransferase [Cyclobacteriaceae bacterium]|nr:methyltransferase domain-containing protein [Cyclobacteriaceae bacterium]MCH8516186.1 class I SAM-dependent methyltransferase [Cyclobacteriaceae bacterium]